jgi:hypothetical protein
MMMGRVFAAALSLTIMTDAANAHERLNPRVFAKQMGAPCADDWHSCVNPKTVKRLLRNPNQHFCTD